MLQRFILNRSRINNKFIFQKISFTIFVMCGGAPVCVCVCTCVTDFVRFLFELILLCLSFIELLVSVCSRLASRTSCNCNIFLCFNALWFIAIANMTRRQQKTIKFENLEIEMINEINCSDSTSVKLWIIKFSFRFGLGSPYTIEYIETVHLCIEQYFSFIKSQLECT